MEVTIFKGTEDAVGLKIHSKLDGDGFVTQDKAYEFMLDVQEYVEA